MLFIFFGVIQPNDFALDFCHSRSSDSLEFEETIHVPGVAMKTAIHATLNALTAVLAVTFLTSSNAHADDADFSNGIEAARDHARSAHPVEPGFSDVSRWRPTSPGDASDDQDVWSHRIPEFNFQDDGALGRISKVRNLSLLTLAEIGRSRLFLGVNGDGLLGLHFNAYSSIDDERYQELTRMPYLRDDQPKNPSRLASQAK